MSTSPNYIRWDAPGVEQEQPNEQHDIKEVAGQFCRFQKLNLNEHGHCYRGTHVKTQGVVIGKLTVKDGLPEHLAQGMFKRPGTYDCAMRYSSLTPKHLPDTVPAPRGIGLKVFGVEGEKIFQKPDNLTQDFLMNNYPILELRTPRVTYEIADSLERNWTDLPKFVEEQQARPDAEIACRGGGLPQQHMAAMPQWSQSSYRHGSYVAKYGLFPKSQAQKDLADWRVKPTDPINILATTLADFHADHDAVYSFCAQMLVDLDAQPVEDIGVEWPEDRFPFEEIATVTFPRQDSFNHAMRNYWNDNVTCNGWHGLVEHKPLGSTNRARRVVYAESRMLREKMNSVKPIIEPRSLADFPVSLEQLAMSTKA